MWLLARQLGSANSSRTIQSSPLFLYWSSHQHTAQRGMTSFLRRVSIENQRNPWSLFGECSLGVLVLSAASCPVWMSEPSCWSSSQRFSRGWYFCTISGQLCPYTCRLEALGTRVSKHRGRGSRPVLGIRHSIRAGLEDGRKLQIVKIGEHLSKVALHSQRGGPHAPLGNTLITA